MIHGTLNQKLEAVASLDVLGDGTRGLRVEAIIDTGFNGFLSLPGSMIQSLNLTTAGLREGTLADGSTVHFKSYLARAIWENSPRRITVIESSGGNLLGMSLLRGSRLTINVAQKGTFSVEPLEPMPP